MERLQKVNKEIARAAEVMAQISKTLEWLLPNLLCDLHHIHQLSNRFYSLILES